MLTTFNLKKREDVHYGQTTPSEGRLMMGNTPHSKKKIGIVCGCVFGIPAAIFAVLFLSALFGGLGYSIGGPLWAHANGSSGMLIAGKVLVGYGAFSSAIGFIFWSTIAVIIGGVIAVAVATSGSSSTPSAAPTHTPQPGNNGFTAAGNPIPTPEDYDTSL